MPWGHVRKGSHQPREDREYPSRHLNRGPSFDFEPCNLSMLVDVIDIDLAAASQHLGHAGLTNAHAVRELHLRVFAVLLKCLQSRRFGHVEISIGETFNYRKCDDPIASTKTT